MPSFCIAIPTHKRAAVLVKKTLRFLAENLVPADIIHLFIQPEEIPDYLAVLPADYPVKIIHGAPGTRGQRAAIEAHFPIGTRLLCLDDDVTGVKILNHPGLPLIDMIENCFETACAAGCNLWGVYPNDNGLSMRPEIYIGITFIIGAFYGVTLKYRLDYPSNLTEDFERSLQHYIRDGRVCRYNYIGLRTKFCGPGGLEQYRKGTYQEDECIAFQNRYPIHCRLRRRPGRHTDIVIRSKAQKKISV